MHRLQVGQHQHAASYCRVSGKISCVRTNRPVTTTEIAGYFWPALGVFSVFSATIWAKFVDEEAYPASLATYFANYFHEGDGILYIRQATSKIADPLTRRRTILASCWEGGAKSFREEEESKKRCSGREEVSENREARKWRRPICVKWSKSRRLTFKFRCQKRLHLGDNASPRGSSLRINNF